MGAGWPIPWGDAACARAGTVHLGGALDEIARSERQTWSGGHPDRPFVLLSQPTLFDPSRAPHDRHIAWAYCHVPHGSTADASEAIEAQLERVAPGFRARVLARHVMTAAAHEVYNPNFVGGDITGGSPDLRQLFFRPTRGADPYHAGPGLYLGSSSTPPGGGVHGMSGHLAARSALRRELR